MAGTQTRLGELLLTAKLVTEDQLQQALQRQATVGGQIGQSLLALGFVDETTLAAAISHQLGLPVVDLDRVQISPRATTLVPVGLAERWGLMPMGERRDQGRILLAASDPTSTDALDAVRQATGMVPELSLATPSAIDRAIRRHYYGEEGAVAGSPSPLLNVTRTTLEPPRPPEEVLADRVAGLEERLGRLEQVVQAVVAELRAARQRP